MKSQKWIRRGFRFIQNKDSQTQFQHSGRLQTASAGAAGIKARTGEEEHFWSSRTIFSGKIYDEKRVQKTFWLLDGPAGRNRLILKGEFGRRRVSEGLCISKCGAFWDFRCFRLSKRQIKLCLIFKLIFLVANSGFGVSIFTILVDIYNTILSIHRKDALGSK